MKAMGNSRVIFSQRAKFKHDDRGKHYVKKKKERTLKKSAKLLIFFTEVVYGVGVIRSREKLECLGNILSTSAFAFSWYIFKGFFLDGFFTDSNQKISWLIRKLGENSQSQKAFFRNKLLFFINEGISI